ncbi:MAG TPA: SUF system Fe-S cluster assembly regulator [Thermoanaerobaculia bacterium]|nr:SUF system Fe-S cluster assembly regulator [Thermoanaerobaculia bacterium]
MAKLTDYGIVLLTQFAARQDVSPMTARELAALAKLPQPTVGKLLKQLSHNGLLSSLRGTKGGYSLARPAREISVAQIIEALEGPMALTECQAPGVCEQERFCSVKPNWLVINRTVRDALAGVTLADMTRPIHPVFSLSLPSVRNAGGLPPGSPGR